MPVLKSASAIATYAPTHETEGLAAPAGTLHKSPRRPSPVDVPMPRAYSGGSPIPLSRTMSSTASDETKKIEQFRVALYITVRRVYDMACVFSTVALMLMCMEVELVTTAILDTGGANRGFVSNTDTQKVLKMLILIAIIGEILCLVYHDRKLTELQVMKKGQVVVRHHRKWRLFWLMVEICILSIHVPFFVDSATFMNTFRALSHAPVNLCGAGASCRCISIYQCRLTPRVRLVAACLCVWVVHDGAPAAAAVAAAAAAAAAAVQERTTATRDRGRSTKTRAPQTISGSRSHGTWISSRCSWSCASTISRG